MKHYHLLRCAVAALAASVLLTNASLTSAQDANRPGGQGGRGGAPAALQNMSEEQREALREMNQETRELAGKVSEARADLNNAIFAEKVDETQIKQKAAALAKVEAELAVARAKAFAKVRSKFTSEQIEALKNMPGGGRGFGPGGRGGRGRSGNQ